MSERPFEATTERATWKRAWPWRAAVVLCTVLVLAAGWVFWIRAQPALPELDLEGADPRFVQVLATARQAVLQEPRSAEAWGHLGMLLYQHRFEPQARICFGYAERFQPHDARWPYLIAQIDRADDGSLAAVALKRALGADENNAIVRLQLAEILHEQGHSEEARRHFRAVLDRPRHETPFAPARAALGLARLALQGGHLDEALDWGERAEQMVPTLKPPHVLLAEIHLRRGDATSAQRSQRKLESLAEMKWPDPYREEMEQLSVEVHPRIELARQFLAQNRTAEGVALLEATVQSQPRSVPTWISLGQARLRTQEWEAAQRALEQALALNPDEAVALADLAYALSRQEQWERAIDLYRKAIDLNRQGPENYYHLSSCLFRLDRKVEALEALRTAVRLRPHFALAWRELGQILAGQGEHAEARVCLRRALELAPDDDLVRKRLEELK